MRQLNKRIAVPQLKKIVMACCFVSVKNILESLGIKI